jgi:acetylornithine/succinyldiaminopimelate/putrescine aminotransferase
MHVMRALIGVHRLKVHDVADDVILVRDSICTVHVAGKAVRSCSFTIAAAAGIAFIETVDREKLLPHAQQLGELFRNRLLQLQQECNLVRDVRVRGVMIGIELSIEGAATVKACLDRRLLINCTHGTVIRLLPALNLTEEQAHEGCDILADVLKKQAGNHLPTQ